MTDKIRVATTSLAGCFGCHMSFLDIDERMLELAELVEFNRTPITDIKHCSDCDIGLIEGGVCNSENVHVLREFRSNCKILVAVGACAINGGLPAMRNFIPLEECLTEAYIDGIGVIEAPRGTLFHHYQIDENDIVIKANLIVSTTSNNQAMNESVRQVAATYLDGRELTEPLLNHLEVAIRAYDPCFSCATHALGKMPLQLELVDANGQVIDRLVKESDGLVQRSLPDA